MNGILIINKPKGWTSFDVVAKVRGILKNSLPKHGKIKPPKVGHTGTLDPMATGVLVLCVGSATKKVNDIMATEKEYVAEITLGATSTTDDAEGAITTSEQVLASEPPQLSTLQKTLNSFVGTFDQMPPQFSAKKIEGQRAYDLARAGKTADLKPVSVTVLSLDLLHYEWPILKIRLTCSKGFYVRSLARDLGKKLGTGGYLSALERTRVGQFAIGQAITIEQVSPASLSQS